VGKDKLQIGKIPAIRLDPRYRPGFQFGEERNRRVFARRKPRLALKRVVHLLQVRDTKLDPAGGAEGADLVQARFGGIVARRPALLSTWALPIPSWASATRRAMTRRP